MKLVSYRGFTLIETTVSLLILGASIILFGAIAISFKNTKDTTYQNIALSAAQAKLDELRALGYSALPASGTFSSSLVTSLPSGRGSTTISTYNTKVKQVAVAVSWLGAASTTRSVTLTTLVTDVGGL